MASLFAVSAAFPFSYHLVVARFLDIEQKGEQDRQAPIIVVNHTCPYDIFYILYKIFPSFVARVEELKNPIVGPAIVAAQGVLVDRTDVNSRNSVRDRIIERTEKFERENGQWPPMLMFPEATTVNNTAIISFKLGAFYPGKPVQPVVLAYRSKHRYDPSWVCGTNLFVLIWRTLCEPYHILQVHYLPTYYPSSEEKADPQKFADNVRKQMASALGVETTKHSFEDVRLQLEAMKHALEPKDFVLEWRRFVQMFPDIVSGCNNDIRQALDFVKLSLAQFARVKHGHTAYEALISGKSSARPRRNTPIRSGFISFDEFVRAFAVVSSVQDDIVQMFQYGDVMENGHISFAEFLVQFAIPSLSKNTGLNVADWAYRKLACQSEPSHIIQSNDFICILHPEKSPTQIQRAYINQILECYGAPNEHGQHVISSIDQLDAFLRNDGIFIRQLFVSWMQTEKMIQQSKNDSKN
eukprot:CAMPEP_0201548708 /NCGR_PEP_ID=MMETSP0173_2-20130828/5223_1 /ASSEMBLY_ACC=CAM_ASM_000268 /TAXON_ID=218659 /ORGANISM="Vexillifera sp., Strain DIVA3 564/2" /LENGTH=466 /DNA_ID=CAMNT_0047958161 /DNA_START=226 /DNA_END=1627 /DNA_ORIENTATION=-